MIDDPPGFLDDATDINRQMVILRDGELTSKCIDRFHLLKCRMFGEKEEGVGWIWIIDFWLQIFNHGSVVDWYEYSVFFHEHMIAELEIQIVGEDVGGNFESDQVLDRFIFVSFLADLGRGDGDERGLS